MPESPWPMLMGRISHGSLEQLEEAFLRQPVSSPPESVDAELQNTVPSHTFAEEVTISLETRAEKRGVLLASGQDDQK